VHVDCAPVNDFGYVGWAEGDLAIGPRTADGAFEVSGTLRLRYRFVDDAETANDVQVEGTVDKHGQYVSARVVSGADDLERVFFALPPSAAHSSIDGPNGSPAYQTRCGASTADVPQGSDLRPEGSMRFYDRGDGTIGVQIDVLNIGNQPASGASGRARIGTSTAAAELHAYFGGTATTPHTVNPGERGYVKVVLPQGALTRCVKPQTVIDLDHTFQSGDPDPFANDTAEVWTQCLTWSRAIGWDSLGSAPDPFLEGKTLGNIVGSAQVGRKDGNLCSKCHYDVSGNRYAPPLPKDGSATVDPTDAIGDTTWAAPGGWAARFLASPIGKPDYLKAVVQQWLDDGARP
jgi:hypothetical protein